MYSRITIRGAAAAYLAGVPISKQLLILSRGSTFSSDPAFRSASRIATGLAAVFLWLFFSFPSLHAAPLPVTVVLSESSNNYLEFTDALRESLLRKNIALTVTEDIARPVPGNGLVICVGLKAATAIAPSNAHAVLNVFIPKHGYEELLRDFPQRANSRVFSAIYMDQPAERQVRLIKFLLPGKRRVGVLFESYPPEELAQLRQRVIKHGLRLREQKVVSDTQLYGLLQGVLDDSDVLLAVPDTAIYNKSTIRNIMLTTFRSGDPVIGFSPGYVRSGALAALFSTPAQVAAQAALAVRQFGETRTLPAAQFPQMFEVMVNEQIARSLGLSIRSADELRDEISEISGDEP